MNSLHGSCLSFPPRPDRRGTLATVSARTVIIKESILSIIETRVGERVMVPDYGIPDLVFAVNDPGFAARLAYFVKQQIERYEPLVEQVKVVAGIFEEEQFRAGFAADQHRAAIQIIYTERGSNVPRNLVYPVWRLAA